MPSPVLDAPAAQVADSVPPAEAWALASSGQAVLVDVRTPEELAFVGRVPGAVNVPWATGTALTRNPRFVRELEHKLPDKSRRLLLLCRSGKRSALALEAARKAGYAQASHVAEGFEGELDDQGRRGQQGGWRFHGLPWQQD
ncbi:MAG: rhodanese-like domain-containing protein [Rubrivivax sp.]